MAQDPKKAAAKAVDERAKELQDAQAESQRVMDESQPTPTQRENDLAKVGALDIDKKEDDKSGPDTQVVQVRQVASESGSATYRNRADKSS